ncbi:hypothetical protein ACJJTC_012594 [Scirpophaga incertulas]
MSVIDGVCDLLQTHANRDKVVSVVSYALKLWGSSANRAELLAASARLASTRSSLRLFDDAAAIKAIAAYGFGKKEGLWWGLLGVANGLLVLGYLQAEKVVWLLDVGILKLPPTQEKHARTAHKLFWSLYAFVAFIRSLRALHSATLILKCPSRTKCTRARYYYAALTTTKLLLDTVHAVCWLPTGWLWGGQVPSKPMAVLGLVPAVLALVLHHSANRLSVAR